jgi:hypothetical protein
VIDILCNRIEISDLLLFESNSYPRRRNARLMDFYNRTNYCQNEPVNKAILIFWYILIPSNLKSENQQKVCKNANQRNLQAQLKIIKKCRNTILKNQNENFSGLLTKEIRTILPKNPYGRFKGSTGRQNKF